MGRIYGEPVEAQTSQDGRPIWFRWRNRLYTVSSVQEYWLVNREWWRETDPVPGHPGFQFWRVEASAGQGRPPGTYELQRDIADGTWTLRRIAD